jgi:hypothetical protein
MVAKEQVQRFQDAGLSGVVRPGKQVDGLQGRNLQPRKDAKILKLQ